MKESNLIERISNSALPALYRKKLCFDLETIFQSNLPELKQIILFGSCARNQVRVGSDIDLLILTEHPVKQAVRGDLASELAEPREGIVTDLVFYTEKDFQASDCRLVQEIRKDGVILWEEEYV